MQNTSSFQEFKKIEANGEEVSCIKQPLETIIGFSFLDFV